MATYLEHAPVEEGQALVKHRNGLIFLQLQGLLEVLHRRHVVLARGQREHSVRSRGQKPRARANVKDSRWSDLGDEQQGPSVPVETGRRLQLDSFGQIGQSLADAPQWRQDLRVPAKKTSSLTVGPIG